MVASTRCDSLFRDKSAPSNSEGYNRTEKNEKFRTKDFEKSRTYSDQDLQKFENLRPDQNQQNYENIGPIRTDLAVRESLVLGSF